jgi:hypothetical protein
VKKGPHDPFVLSGTSVKLGTASYVVTGVGLFSEEGLINKIITGVGKAEVGSLDFEALHVLGSFLCLCSYF